MISLKKSEPGQSLAVVVTCHQPYLRFLSKCIAPILVQAQRLAVPVRLILCLDHVANGVQVNETWEIVRGDWHNPNGGRNAGLLAVAGEVDWILFWDVDNVMPPGFLEVTHREVNEAGPDVGILYPKIHIGDRQLGVNHGKDLRDAFYVDTASAWRVNAILSAGRWDERLRRLDDWSLSKRVTAAGWKAVEMPLAFEKGVHGESRSSVSQAEGVFEGRSLGIVSLMRGQNPDHLERFFHCLRNLDLPFDTGLTLMDNSGNPHFRQELERHCAGLGGWQRISILTAAPVSFPSEHQSRFVQVHNHIAYLYGRAIGATPEDSILTWEDDNFPRNPDAVRKLAMEMRPGRNVGIVASLYQSRNNRRHACAARDRESWTNVPLFEEMKEMGRPAKFGMVGGGFTLWNRIALEQNPIRGPRKVPWIGWDGDVCRRIREAGRSVILHCGVVCDHLFDE